MRMHSVAHYGGGMNGTAGLPWQAYSLCGRATSDHHSVTSVTVLCAAPLHGRWLLVRRHQQPLQVCLLAVYVRKGTPPQYLIVVFMTTSENAIRRMEVYIFGTEDQSTDSLECLIRSVTCWDSLCSTM